MDTAPDTQFELDESSNEELAARAAAGSSSCFEALVHRLGPRLLRYLRQKLPDAHTAEDVLQETFLKVFRNLDRYDPSRSFATWLFTIATRLAVSYWRSRRPTASMANVEPSAPAGRGPLATAARREEQANLWATARRVLPESQFTALWLRYADDLPNPEIARVMGKSVGGVKVLLHRACRKLTRRGGEIGPAGHRAKGGRPGEYAVETGRGVSCVVESIDGS